jgi:hypothetical protein
VIKRCVALVLTALACNAWAGVPTQDDLAACQAGTQRGRTHVTEIDRQVLSEEDDYWRGYSASTSIFRGRAVGHASKDQDEGIAFNGRVYPLKQAKLINLSREEFNDQLARGSISIQQPADWYWLKGRQQFLCIATNKSMSKATPILILLSMDRVKRVFVAEGTAYKP